MKKIVLLVVFITTVFVQASYAQDSTNSQSSALLQSYFDVKNALIAGNGNTASTKAAAFAQTLQGLSAETVNDASRSALLNGATQIAESKDIKQQREHFASFSADMYALAKAVKLTTEPIYYAYCPMKKAHWLSHEATIKNPYFGSSMLTCGKVEETLK